MLSAEVTIQPQFYDLDPMKVVWHGNNPRFFEVARSALLDRIGYDYTEMAASGFVWPVVDLHVKYMRPIRLGQTIRVGATLVEFEPRMRIAYRIADAVTGEALTKASTTQLAVEMASGHTLLEAPPLWIELVRAALP